MKRFQRIILFALVCLLVSAACCAGASAEKVLKIGNTQQLSHPINIALETMKAMIEEGTKGGIRVDIYPAGQLGAGEYELLDQIILGTLEAGLLMGGPGLISSTDGRCYFEELPYVFTSIEEARAAYDGEFGEWVIREVMEPQGFKCFGFWESGFRNITNNIRPITVPDDLKGIKFRVDRSGIRADTFNLLGAAATPMAFGELFTGLQQGTVNGQENPLAIIISSRFYEVQKYLAISEHIYNSACFVMNPAFYDRLTPEELAVIEAAFEAGKTECRALLDKNNAEAIAFLEAQGMEITYVDKAAFVEAVQPIWDAYIQQYGDEFLQKAGVR